MIYGFIFLIISGINGNINYISINRPEVITMSLITINGTQYNVTENIKLMPFLRDNLHLTSVKNGCNEGACGTCTVIINGRAMKACVQKTANLDGKTVITCEGLSDREKDVYSYAFAKVGAVQCGFCTPGLIMSAVEIVGTGKKYNREELKKLISGHLCRCTGYENILNAMERIVEEVYKVSHKE